MPDFLDTAQAFAFSVTAWYLMLALLR